MPKAEGLYYLPEDCQLNLTATQVGALMVLVATHMPDISMTVPNAQGQPEHVSMREVLLSKLEISVIAREGAAR